MRYSKNFSVLTLLRLRQAQGHNDFQTGPLYGVLEVEYLERETCADGLSEEQYLRQGVL
jgi:hypothetical protein